VNLTRDTQRAPLFFTSSDDDARFAQRRRRIQGNDAGFRQNYAGKSATTEDFKAIVAKHRNADMKSIGGGKMDWFFDDYVYGNQLPTYQLTSSLETSPEGDVVLVFKLPLQGNTTVEQKIPLKGIKDKPHCGLINCMDDVLSNS